MKKYILLILSILYIQNTNFACEVCGCALGNLSLGLLPNYKKGFIGLSYDYQKFHSFHEDENINSIEKFSTINLSGRIVVYKNLFMLVNAPYKINRQNFDTATIKNSGLGDITLRLEYMLYRNNFNTLVVGAGAKLPTGNYENTTNGKLLNPYLQIGSGSFDIPFSLLYVHFKNKIGEMTEANYNVNNLNKLQHSFGNSLFLSEKIYYQYATKNWILMPQIGASFQYFKQDISNKEYIDGTGGHLWKGHVGANVYYKKYGGGLHINPTIHSTLGEGNVNPKNSIILDFKILI